MSGPYPINIARSLFIPRPCGLDLKTSATLALDASSLDEKQGLDENEKTEGVNGSAQQGSLSFSREAITKALDDLVAYARQWLAFPSLRNSAYPFLKAAYLSQYKQAPALLKEAVLQPALPVVTPEPEPVDLPKSKFVGSDRINEALDLLIEIKKPLKEERYSLAGTTSPTEKEV